jgi:nickel/cobalt exporter
MMGLTIALTSGLGYGVLHGFGPDHCAAVASLAVRGNARHAAAVGFRFGLSHAAALGSLVLLAVALGVSVPAELERGCEVLGGALLCALGAMATWGDGAVLTVHRHRGLEHAHDSGWHAHLGGAGWLGGLFAASGVRSLVLLVSPLLAGAQSWLHGVVFVLAFALGVMAAMVACGLVLALLHGALPSHGNAQRWLARAVGVLSVALGAYWVVAAATSR